MIERDANIPELGELLTEMGRARAIQKELIQINGGVHAEIALSP